MFICDVLRDLVQFFQLKNVKNTHGRLFTKSETPPCVFFLPNRETHHICSKKPIIQITSYFCMNGFYKNITSSNLKNTVTY